MAHYAIAVIGSNVDQQMQQVQHLLEWDRYKPFSESQYGFDRVAGIVQDGKVVQLSWWEESEQPLIAELPESATVLDIHR